MKNQLEFLETSFEKKMNKEKMKLSKKKKHIDSTKWEWARKQTELQLKGTPSMEIIKHKYFKKK